MKMSGGSRVWTEARKQERRLKGMMVDYKKRAERRREYYDRIKTDPSQFMQVHGRSMKIHLDPSLAAQAEASSTMVHWQNQADTIIDRFDVRAHLDVIPEVTPTKATKSGCATPSPEESQINYERYRILVQNDYAQVKEHKFLHQIYLEERFGGSTVKKMEQEAEKRKLAEKKAAIGYNYDGETSADQGGLFRNVEEKENPEEADAEGQEDSEEEFDLDIVFDVDQIPTEQAREMNLLSGTYGMTGTEFIDQLVRDKAELEALREAKAVEEERAAGRRNRRDRRRAREQARARDLNTLRTGDAGQTMGLLASSLSSLPAYAAAETQQELASRAGQLLRSDRSSSRSPSPDERGKVCFITSFGGDSGDEAVSRRSRSISPSSRNSRSATSTKRQRGSSPAGRGSQVGQRGSTRKTKSSSSSSDDSVSSRERRRRRARKNGSQQSHERRRRSRNRERNPSSSTSSSSTSRSRSRSRSKGQRRSVSPKPPAKLPTPPRKSYYRHDLKSDGSAEEDSSPDDETSQTSDIKNHEMVVDTHLMQHMPAAVQGQILGQAASDVNSGSELGSREDRKEKEDERRGSGGGIITGAKPPGKLTPQERLRRKMQAMLKKTHQTDQLARMEKEEKAREEWMQRQEQLKEHVAKYGRSDRRFGSDESDEGFSPRRRSPSRDRTEWAGSAHSRDIGGRDRSRSRDRQRRGSRSTSRSRQRRSQSRNRQRRSRSRDRTRNSPGKDRRRGNGGYHQREQGFASSSSRWSRERSNERRGDDRYRDSRRDRSRERNFSKTWDRERSPRRRDDRRTSYR